MTLPMVLLRYILREMSKVFLLTALALSAILGLGGGLLKVIKLGEMTPGQLLWLMALVLPVAAALTLPIAALFSASATYGRLSADNEFVACRSSGINMHVLFLPTLALGLASATVTLLFINFLIPGMVRNLNEFVAMDVGAMIQQRLKRPRGITLGGRFRIHADSSVVNSADPNEVVLRKVAFVEVDDAEWVRFGTAGEVRLRFDRRERSLRVSGRMRNLSYYDRKDSRFGDIAEQEIPPNELPALVPQEIKFLNLGQLFYYWRNPGEWREVREETERLRRAVGSRFVYDEILEIWRDGEGLTLEDDRLRITIRSPGRPMRIPRDGGIEIANPTIEQHYRGRVRRVSANRAVIELVRGDSLEESGIQIQAYDAKVTTDESSIDRVKETLGPVAAPAEIIDRAMMMTTAELMHIPSIRSESDPLAERRASASAVRGEAVRKIVATVSERFAFSASVLVLVILGAALGIIFRGAQIVTAFGISFVPSLLVIILIVMGKQMAQNAPTHYLGLLVMWSGIIAVSGLNVWILTRVLRR